MFYYDKTKLLFNFASVINSKNYKKRAFLLTALLMFVAFVVNAATSFTLVIDAGHGGHDVGARGSFSNEKDINLKVALAFGSYVEKNCPDVRVIYTRKTDVFIPLHKRADIANKSKANVFVSIHTNALPAGRIARGLETYTMGMRRSNEKLSAAQRENAVITYESDYKQRYEGYDPNSPESAIMFEFIHDKNMAKSVELAKLVQKNVCATANRPDKGVKQDVFLVLRETSMPACLIELGFISTPDEERLLNDAVCVDNMARGIYNAFAKYKNDNSSGFTVPYEAKNNTEVKIPTIVPNDFPDDKKASKANKVNKEQINTGNSQNLKRDESQGVNDTKDTYAVNKGLKADKSDKTNAGEPVFKVQIVANKTKLAKSSSMFKGKEGIEYYYEGGMYKYTIGSSTNFNEISKLRKELAETFPGAFVVAFKNGEKMNVNDAIRQFKSKKR